jgi:hypothetical protein
MNTKNILRIFAAVCVVSCSAARDSGTERVASTSQADTPANIPGFNTVLTIPHPTDGIQDAWPSTSNSVDLAAADAIAACAPWAGAGAAGSGFSAEQVASTDEYLGLVYMSMQQAMSTVANGPVNGDGAVFPQSQGTPTTFDNWRWLRSLAVANFIPGTSPGSSVQPVNLIAPTGPTPTASNQISQPIYGPAYSVLANASLQGLPFTLGQFAGTCQPGVNYGSVPLSYARVAIARPATLLCVATQLRKLMPSTGAAGALTMSGPELRQLEDITGRLARQAVLGFTKLAQLAATPNSKSNGIGTQVFANYYLPLNASCTWGYSSGAYLVSEQYLALAYKLLQGLSSLDQWSMAEDFQTAVNYARYAAQDELALRYRDAWAGSDRGTVFPATPPQAGAQAAPTTPADAFWGHGSWVQRAEASMFGGRDLASPDASAPWSVTTGPLSVGTNAAATNDSAVGYSFVSNIPPISLQSPGAYELDWPNAPVNGTPAIEEPYVSTPIVRPQVLTVEKLARQYRDPVTSAPTALEFSLASVAPPPEPPSAATGLPGTPSTKACYRIDASATSTNAANLYGKIEQGERAQRKANWTGTTPPPVPAPPSTAHPQSTFQVYQDYGVTFEDAQTYVSYVADIVGTLCLGPGSSLPTSQLQGSDIHLIANNTGIHFGPDTVFADNDVLQRASAYGKLATFRLPESYNMLADAREYGFPLGPSNGTPMDLGTLYLAREEAGLGYITVLTAAKQAILKVASTQGFSGILANGPDVLDTIKMLAGDEGFVVRPQIAPVTTPSGSVNSNCVPTGATFYQSLPTPLANPGSQACPVSQAVSGSTPIWDVDVTFNPTTPFWSGSLSTDTYKVYAIPMNVYAGMLARDPATQLNLGQTYNGVVYTNIATLLTNFAAANPTLVQTVPAGAFYNVTMPGGYQPIRGFQLQFVLPVPTSAVPNSSWTFIVTDTKTGSPTQYHVLGDNVKIQPTVISGTWASTQSGFYISQSSDPGHPALLTTSLQQLLRTDPQNRSRALTDPFGFAYNLVPQLPPSVLQQSAGTDSITYWMTQAQSTASAATMAFQLAAQALVDAQSDQAVQAAAVAKAQLAVQNAEQGLCGNAGTCNPSQTNVLLSSDPNIAGYISAALAAINQDYYNLSQEGAVPAFVTPPSWTTECASASVAFTLPMAVYNATSDTYAFQYPQYMSSNWKLAIDCMAYADLSLLAAAPIPVSQPVADAYNGGIQVPTFSTYSGGSLAPLFSTEFDKLQTAHDKLVEIATQRGKIDNLMDQAAWGLAAALDDVNTQHFTEEDACAPTAWQILGEVVTIVAAVVTVAAVCVLSAGTGCAPTLAGALAIAGAAASAAGGAIALGQSVTKNGTNACDAAASKYQMTQDNDRAVGYAAMASLITDFDGYQQAHHDVISALNDVITAELNIRSNVSAAQLAQSTSRLDANVAGNSSKTSFGTYRVYHNSDFDRVFALLQTARQLALLARRDLEAQYLVDLSTMKQDEALVKAPSTWADSVYSYDLSTGETVGLNVLAPGGIAVNAVADYVNNLSLFVQGFGITRPTAVAKNDVVLYAVDGPGQAKTFNGVTIPSEDAQRWAYHCPIENTIVRLTYSPNFITQSTPPQVQYISLPTWSVNPSTICPTQANGQIEWPDTASITLSLREVVGNQTLNVRWDNLALNLVGTGIRNCAAAADPNDCYTNPFIRANFTHEGPVQTNSYDGVAHTLFLPTAFVQQAKVLTAEEILDPVSNGFATSYVSAVARADLQNRPLAGQYTIELELTPDVQLNQIQSVQILAQTHYWEREQNAGQQ